MRLRRRERGQSLVEFALLVPAFAMLTMGALDAGRLFHAYLSLENGAREAAIYAGTSGGTSTNAQLLSIVTAEGAPEGCTSITLTGPTTITGTLLSTGGRQTYYKVVVTCQFSFVTSPLHLANPFTLNVSAMAPDM